MIAIDAQFTPELAKKSVEYLRRFTDKPISWLVITHPNPDKFNGASVFKAMGAKVIASRATARAIPEVHAYKEYFFVHMAKMFEKGRYPQPVSVDQTFEGQLDLALKGGEKLLLKELSLPGVSGTQTVAYAMSARALFVGDLIHHKAHAWLEGGIVNGHPRPSVLEWISDLEELTTLFPASATVYGGRGLNADLHTAVREQIRYLRLSVELIDRELRKLGPKAKEFLGPKAGLLYQALAEQFRAQFPDYQLPYMIEYGAYGLVQHRLGLMKMK